MFRFFLIFILISVVLVPDLASAQGLVPTDLCDGKTCSACHMVELGNRLIQFLISLAMMLFAVLAVWAGFGLVTSGGNPSALEDAKKKFTNAIIGLLIILSAGILVDTLIRGITSNTGGNVQGYGPWATVECMTQASATTVPGTLDIDIPSAGTDSFIGPGPGGIAGPVNAVSISGDCFPGANGVFDGGPLQGGDDVCLSGYQVAGTDYNLPDGGELGYSGPSLYFGPEAIADNPQLTPNLRLCDVTNCSLDKRKGDYVALDPTMVSNLDLIYQDMGGVQINSGYRSPAYNQSVGGATHSRHQYGDAVDIAVTANNTEAEIVATCKARGATFTMTYDSGRHVHCDWR